MGIKMTRHNTWLRFKSTIQRASTGIQLLLLSFMLIIMSLGLNSCRQQSSHSLRVGTTPGLYADLMRFAVNKALRSNNLAIKLSIQPAASLNPAVSKQRLDANIFQTVTALKLYNRVHPQQPLYNYGRTYITPMAMYSFNRNSISQIQAHDRVLIPENPITQAIALQLLQKAGVIKLKPHPHQLYSLNDVSMLPSLPIQVQAAHISHLSSTDTHATNVILLYPNQALALGYTNHNMLFSDEQSLNQALIVAGPQPSSQQHNILLLLQAIRSQELQQMIPTLMHGATFSKGF